MLSVGELKDYCATEDSFKRCQFFKETELNEEEIESGDPNILLSKTAYQ